MPRLAIAPVCLYGLIFAACGSEWPHEVEPDASPSLEAELTNSPRTTGGPQSVRLSVRGSWCGATVLTRHWLITAAHCVDQGSIGDDALVTTGEETLYRGQADYFVHPDWGGETEYSHDTDDDMALVRLRGSGLPRVPGTAGLYWSDMDIGDHVTVFGFGWGSDPGDGASCEEGTLGTKRVMDYALKTIGWQKLEVDYGTTEICPGDSGSGWLMELSGRPVVTGVTAARRPYHDADACRVAAKFEWLTSTMSTSGSPAVCPRYMLDYYPYYYDCFEAEQRALSLSAGRHHACAGLADGRVRCWGSNASGQLGDESLQSGGRPVTAHLFRAGDLALEVSAGRSHTCARVQTAEGIGVQCWGVNTHGQLGDPAASSAAQLRAVVVHETPSQPLRFVSQIAVGANHSCALTSDGRVRCWGLNSDGQLGNDSTTSASTAQLVGYLEYPMAGEPAPAASCFTVPGLVYRVFCPIENVVAIDAGYAHTCAVTGGGQTLCWGDNSYGQLGVGSTTDSRVPVVVAGITGAKRVSAGDHHTCVIRGSFLNAASCWGKNTYGQLANGTTTTALSPVTVALNMGYWVQVSAGAQHTCFGGGSTSLQKCAGLNNNGALGNWFTTSSATLVETELEDVVRPVAGEHFTCTLLGDGSVSCTGVNSYGQLGQGTTTGLLIPHGVHYLHTVPELDAYLDD